MSPLPSEGKVGGREREIVVNVYNLGSAKTESNSKSLDLPLTSVTLRLVQYPIVSFHIPSILVTANNPHSIHSSHSSKAG